MTFGVTLQANYSRNELNRKQHSSSFDSSVAGMSKRYELIRRRIFNPEGGFMEAFIMGIAEYSCLGEHHFDLAGYPYESELEAFSQDWQALKNDAFEAANNLSKKQKK